MAGGVRVPATLRPPTPEQPRWHPDLDELAASITDRTRVLLLNSPHNPTGMVLNEAELRRLAELAVTHDLIVITDEVYEHLVFEGSHVPIATLPGMRDRTVSISSSGKTFSFTGWKIGWVTATPELVSAVRTAKQFLTYVSGGPFQYAVAEALKLPRDYYTELRESLRTRRDLLASGLADIGFGVAPTEGTYFITTDIRPLGADDGIAFCRALPERCGVVAIPNAVFYDDKQAGAPFVRFTFCKKPEVLTEALDRLAVLAKPA
jgi:N-succinyldiaminopimelate aminotransferase